eukprot:TRINITY_DN27663_c0_g1_i1.p1 TRINITY_DN27663_c0_g1~~TRINITY_DN27663_c0_g1_i1.p1  ORF type:complete len:625 (+),score=142.67 TRINITY_DN27663_c0_g1_i1:114-1988(+)
MSFGGQPGIVLDRAPSVPPADKRRPERGAEGYVVGNGNSAVVQEGNVVVPPVAPSPEVATKTNYAEATERQETMEQIVQQGVRQNKPLYSDTPLISVGKQVRVEMPGCCRRAVIDCIDEGDKTVDVTCCGMGDGTENTEQEEATVSFSAVRALEDFEVNFEDLHGAHMEDLYSGAALAKELGNKLFKMKDYEAAAHLYGQAIDKLHEFREPQPGNDCWVLMNQCGALALGSVRSVNVKAEKAEVSLYRTDVNQIQVFKGAPWRSLIPVHEDYLVLHSSLYTNRAKSLVQMGRHQEAAQDLTVTIGLWAARDEGARRGGGKMTRSVSATEVAEQREQLTKAYFMRSKTRLARMKLEQARSDVNEAKSLKPAAAMVSLLQQLERDIDSAQKEQVRSNKKIAKEVAKWADKAMSGMDEAAIAAMEARGQATLGSQPCSASLSPQVAQRPAMSARNWGDAWRLIPCVCQRRQKGSVVGAAVGGVCSSKNSFWVGTWIYGNEKKGLSSFTITSVAGSDEFLVSERCRGGSGETCGVLRPDNDGRYIAEMKLDGGEHLGTMRLRVGDGGVAGQDVLISNFLARGDGATWSSDEVVRRQQVVASAAPPPVALPQALPPPCPPHDLRIPEGS